jgi:hypothetical protein
LTAPQPAFGSGDGHAFAGAHPEEVDFELRSVGAASQSYLEPAADFDPSGRGAALRALWFWTSDPTVSRTIEALAADTPAALKAIDTTAERRLGLWCRGREMGQPRIAVVSRVNWRWPISL